MLGLLNLLHPSCYKQWRATLIALMSSAECSQPSHNEICSRRNRPERLGRTLRHMAETAVISMAGGWMLQIGKRLSHPGLWPWWRVLEKDSPESSTQNMILSFYCCFHQKYATMIQQSRFNNINHFIFHLQWESRIKMPSCILAMMHVGHNDSVLCRAGE